MSSSLWMMIRPVQADIVSKKLRGKRATMTLAHHVAMLAPCPDCEAKAGEMCPIPTGVHPSRYRTIEARIVEARDHLKVAQRRAKLAHTIVKKWQRRVKRLEARRKKGESVAYDQIVKEANEYLAGCCAQGQAPLEETVARYREAILQAKRNERKLS
jgi:hypothetical protein